MNAVEIEEAVSELVAQPFDAAEFPYQFLTAFGAKDTTIKRLRKGESNGSDVPGAVLQRNNIHIAVAPAGQVGTTLTALRASPKTAAQKAKFLFATDGETVEAEDLISDEPPIACAYADLPRHFGFFLPLAGISTVKEIKNNPIDVKATGRLNRLYVELLKDNPDWATAERRPALNQFMARLIFCFFAEDTGIFHGSYRFTPTVERMSDGLSGNTHDVIAELFRAMSTKPEERAGGRFHTWSDGFPYVNGGLFSGADECPRFSRTARAYLLRAGELDWKKINPDIFGSMIQAVADEGERGELGMHYTSVPNILKVLNPLFLDGLREQLEAAGDNRRKLLNLRRRLATIRVFDPACGSGNFLVIAYKEMRKVEAEIVGRLGGEESLKLDDRRSVIQLSNFYGIEIKGFAAEIARLALLIAEFQADCLYLSQQEARAMVLPLHNTGQITVGNALRLDWMIVCPPVARALVAEHDLAGPTGRLALEGKGLEDDGEAATYICGNPPYSGFNRQSAEQKADLARNFGPYTTSFGVLDYVCGWFLKAAAYGQSVDVAIAFVATNSICQGSQVPFLWPVLFSLGCQINFAHTSFKWKNLASDNAGVTVIIVGLRRRFNGEATLYEEDGRGITSRKTVKTIGPYLVPNSNAIVDAERTPLSNLPVMTLGNHPYYANALIFDRADADALIAEDVDTQRFVRPFMGSAEIIAGLPRFCLWITDDEVEVARRSPTIQSLFEQVSDVRSSKKNDKTALALATYPHRFRDKVLARERQIVVPQVSSEHRPYLPCDLITSSAVISFQAYTLLDAPVWVLSVISSKLHWTWIASVCRRMEMRFSYSNTLGWNTFPLPKLTDKNKVDLTRGAESILLAREAHFPATIADLYDPQAMPDDLRRAHDENDEVLERIYIGRHFRNDTERLEKLFELYTKMTADQPKVVKGRKAAA